MSFSTADISDELGARAAIASPGFRRFGRFGQFAGIITTVACPEDNSLVRTALQETSDGRILVIDGGASMNCALLGDLLAARGVENGWQGIIVNGCIRDSAIIDTLEIGVMALATHPRKSVKRGAGERDVVVRFSGIEFRPGDQVYADADGILVTDKPLS